MYLNLYRIGNLNCHYGSFLECSTWLWSSKENQNYLKQVDFPQAHQNQNSYNMAKSQFWNFISVHCLVAYFPGQNTKEKYKASLPQNPPNIRLMSLVFICTHMHRCTGLCESVLVSRSWFKWVFREFGHGRHLFWANVGKRKCLWKEYVNLQQAVSYREFL